MTLTNEILLSRSDIIEIELFAKKNPLYKTVCTFNYGNDIKTLYKISDIHDLLLIKGNDYTGFEHIHYRHEFWTVEPFWKDNPSRFRKSSRPNRDYTQIADSVYNKENLNSVKNKRPDIFDLYIGPHIHEDQTSAIYNLITYKNSKVIHTIFPVEKINNINKPKKFHFKRGQVAVDDFSSDDKNEIRVPYFNSDQQLKYTLLISKIKGHSFKKAFILIHNDQGDVVNFVFVAERPSSNFEITIKEIFAYQYNDLSKFEKLIIKLDNKLSNI